MCATQFVRRSARLSQRRSDGPPVRGYDGAVVAALSVSAPTNRMTSQDVKTAAGYCAEEAAGLSAVLGYRQRAARPTRKAG